MVRTRTRVFPLWELQHVPKSIIQHLLQDIKSLFILWLTGPCSSVRPSLTRAWRAAAGHRVCGGAPSPPPGEVAVSVSERWPSIPIWWWELCLRLPTTTRWLSYSRLVAYFFWATTSETEIFLFLIIMPHSYCVPGDDDVSISVPRWNLKNRFSKCT